MAPGTPRGASVDRPQRPVVALQRPAHPLRHLAIIPDGNRRWAWRRRRPAEDGHRRGFLEVTPEILETVWQRGIPMTTLWLFSVDNWKRSSREVDQLMVIFEQLLDLLLVRTREPSVCLRHLGRKHRLPASLRTKLETAEESTAGMKVVLHLALDYGGLDETTHVLCELMRELGPEADEGAVHRALLDGGLLPPAPDLIIRTSGEVRLSGFMPLQSCASELYFTDTLYPDLTAAELGKAIDAYHRRERRLGQ